MGPMSEAGRGLDRIPGVAEEPDPPFGTLLRACSSCAVHLEMRDSYDREDPWFQAWLVGDQEEFGRRLAPRPWLDLIAEVTGRGVEVRRVRIVSEPVTDYIRFEHATTASNVTAGEQIRWLPRHLATGLLLPANDFWVFDGRQAQFNYFSGRGEFLVTRLAPDPAIARQCTAAFEAAWERAVAHQEYELV